MYLKKGDQVKMLSGKDSGKTGTVIHAFPEEGKVTVEGLNLYKKRVRPKQQGKKGETVLVPRPFPASRAILICKNCKVPSRMGSRTIGNQKVRYCKRCDANN